MSASPRAPGISPELHASFYHFFSYAGGAVASVYLGIWLHEQGMSTEQIGVISAVPVLVMLLAIGFNTLNAWVNARWVSEYGTYPVAWLADPRFWLGLLLFAGGLTLNMRSDRTLRRLRAGGGGYRVPYGGGFRYVSSPNYLGEIVEWTGWAVATWSLAGASFALYTMANLAPRAVANHRWYRETFPEYPRDRRALLPFVL